MMGYMFLHYPSTHDEYLFLCYWYTRIACQNQVSKLLGLVYLNSLFHSKPHPRCSFL